MSSNATTMTYICADEAYCPDRETAFASAAEFQNYCEAAFGEPAPIRESDTSRNWIDDDGRVVLRHCEPSLHDYATGNVMRDATAAELDRSLEAETHDGGHGTFKLDGRVVYVESN